MSENLRLHAFVSGRVQGVGYRSFVTRVARSLGLTGWCRNLEDGRVEVVAEGPREKLKELLSRMEEGPYLARVDGIEKKWLPARNEFDGFFVRYD